MWIFQNLQNGGMGNENPFLVRHHPSYAGINYCLVSSALAFAPTITILFSPSSLLVGPWPVGSHFLSALDGPRLPGLVPVRRIFPLVLLSLSLDDAHQDPYTNGTRCRASGVIAFPVRQRSVSFAPEPLFFPVGRAPTVFVGIFAKSLVCARRGNVFASTEGPPKLGVFTSFVSQDLPWARDARGPSPAPSLIAVHNNDDNNNNTIQDETTHPPPPRPLSAEPVR